MKAARALAVVALLCAGATPRSPEPAIPAGFVDFSAVAPNAIQDIRYAGYHNFFGRPVAGYGAARCILTRQAAAALASAQQELEDAGLTLRVYDCYRPQRAVDEFLAWSKQPSDQLMKAEFYPNVGKSQLFALGYLAKKSAHSRGSAVDLTIERLPAPVPQPYAPGDPLRSCTAPFLQRYHDGSIDMGTGYDCMDPLSHPDADVFDVAQSHRRLLHDTMARHGFKGSKTEWWHYTLEDEPYPNTYFNFPILP